MIYIHDLFRNTNQDNNFWPSKGKILHFRVVIPHNEHLPCDSSCDIGIYPLSGDCHVTVVVLGD